MLLNMEKSKEQDYKVFSRVVGEYEPWRTRLRTFLRMVSEYRPRYRICRQLLALTNDRLKVMREREREREKERERDRHTHTDRHRQREREREKERDGKKRYLWNIDQNIRMALFSSPEHNVLKGSF